MKSYEQTIQHEEYSEEDWMKDVVTFYPSTSSNDTEFIADSKIRMILNQAVVLIESINVANLTRLQHDLLISYFVSKSCDD